MSKISFSKARHPILNLGLVLLMAISATGGARGAVTLVAWDTTGLSGITADPFAATTVVANMESGAGLNELTRGGGLTATSLSNGFAASGWNGTSDLAGAATANNYFQFIVSAASGYALELDEITMNFRTTGTGPMTLQWQYSFDGFATAGTSINSPINRTNPGSGTQIDNYLIDLTAVTALQSVDSDVTFRLFGWNSSGSAGTAAFGTSTGDNLALIGKVELLPVGDDLYWVGNDAILGGAGTWTNTGGTAWRTTDDDGPGGPWNSARRANFGGASSGAVTVSGTVDTTAGISFTTDGYQLSGGTIDLIGNDATANTITTLGGVTATIATDLAGAAGMTKAGGGTLILTGDKSYTGGTTISGGTLQLGDGSTNGSVLGNITNDATLAFNNGSAQTFGGDISGSGSLFKNGPGNLTLSGTNSYLGGTTVNAGTLTGTTTSLQGNITNNAAVAFDQASDATYAGNMSGSGSLTKAGTGNLTLSGINTYSGGTTVSAGILTGTTTSLQGDIANNAAVAFDQNTDGTYAGDMSGSGSLAKNGAGNLTLSGINTYSGGTTVSGGILTGTTDSLQGNIANDTAVVFSQNTDGTYAGDMSGTGSLSKAGVGSVSLSGNNSYSGGTTVTGGTLVAGSNTALGSGDVNVNGATLFAGAGFTVANAITVNEVLAAPALVAYWNFNDYNGGAGPISATAGNGTISLDDWTGTTANFGGSGINALFGDPSGASLSLVSNAGNGSYIEISGLDFVGLTDAHATFATRGTGTGFNEGQWSYSSDGVTFTDFGPNTATRSTTFAIRDTGTTGGLDNSTTGFLRYTLDGATGTGGNNRIDNLQINATIPDAFPVLGTGATSGIATFAGNVTLDSDVELTAAAGGTAAFEGVIQDGANGPAGLTKTGGGTVILSGDNTYTGASLVSGGTLIINGDQSAATGDVLVAAGSTLGGSGIIGGHTTILGTHNPGESPEIQTFAAGLTYGSGSNVEWELIGNTTAGRGVNFDGIDVTGVLDFSAPTPLDLVFNLPGSAVDWSDSFWRTDYFTTDGWLLYEVTNGSINNFDNLFINSTTWLDGFGNSSSAFFGAKEFGLFRDGDRIFLTYTPEPSKAVLLALGLIGLLARRRR